MPTPLVTPASATVQEPSASPDEDDGGALMRTYLAEQPALTDPQRAAFTRQCTAERADALGRRTKAGNVLRDGERFAKVMRSALPAPRGGLAYSKPRFRFYLEALLDLRDHIAKDGEKSLTQNDAAVNVAKARDAALVARETLLERMNAFAAGDDVRAASVSKAAGSTGRRALVALGIPVLTTDYDLWIHIDDIATLNAALAPLDLYPIRSTRGWSTTGQGGTLRSPPCPAAEAQVRRARRAAGLPLTEASLICPGSDARWCSVRGGLRRSARAASSIVASACAMPACTRPTM